MQNSTSLLLVLVILITSANCTQMLPQENPQIAFYPIFLPKTAESSQEGNTGVAAIFSACYGSILTGLSILAYKKNAPLNVIDTCAVSTVGLTGVGLLGYSVQHSKEMLQSLKNGCSELSAGLHSSWLYTKKVLSDRKEAKKALSCLVHSEFAKAMALSLVATAFAAAFTRTVNLAFAPNNQDHVATQRSSSQETENQSHFKQ